MNLSFKNRITLYYTIATAVIVGIVFFAVYVVVHNVVFRNLDADLSYEARKHTDEIKILGDSIVFINMEEWKEREHREIQVNPVFLQIIDKRGRLMDKSPNLKDNALEFHDNASGGHFNGKLNQREIRQAQLPIEQNGKVKGYILAAMSSESAQSLLQNLRNVLLLSYLFVLVGLYFTSRLLAGRSILPIREMTKTINRITKRNLNERVVLPNNKDELYDLASGFNALLQRIENTLARERQFTSDASHELRTPLAALRGTFEVLIRKPRTTEEYEEKIANSLVDIDRMSATIEQLLQLARLDGASASDDDPKIALAALIDEAVSIHKAEILAKNLRVDLAIETEDELLVPQYYSRLILENIISNAIKYSNSGGKLSVLVSRIENRLVCRIQDEGIGIKEEDIPNLFENFFRSDALAHKEISGSGLGLSIAKKAADAIQAKLQIESRLSQGTTCTITF